MQESDEEADGSEADEADFVPYTAALAADTDMLQLLSKGWTAYVVAVTKALQSRESPT